MKLIWLIPLLPAVGAAINGLVGIRWFSRTLAGVVACAAMAGALGLATFAFGDLLARPAGARVYDVVLGTWIPPMPLATASGIGTFTVPWSIRLDPLSAVMLLVVTGVGSLIHVYATAYMKDEPRGGYARFFCYLNLFCFFMLVLVLAGNFLVMFVGWEGVGLCSYLLIGFWYEKPSAADAGKKAFLTNRIGDWACLLGVFLVFFTFGTLDFGEVAAAAAAMPRETGGFGVLSIVCLLLFMGAAGKSAQIPLHVWLPDAMEGPTPVSALIHAATMVTAGVYLVARNAVLFEQAPLVMQVVAIVGALTALTAATIGLVQNDIKRVLAYSTISQLGYMFLATGVGAFAAAVFHLVTHALFKALLFLGSGSVIHAVAGEQDMQRMGGLKKHMPVTFITMLIGTLAIAGIPPLSGFFSKDEILLHAFAGNRILWAIALATAGLTACYMFRVMALTFYGSYRGPEWTRLASPAAVAEATAHGVPHPRDAHAHGQAERKGHEVTHGAADALGARPRQPASAVRPGASREDGSLSPAHSATIDGGQIPSEWRGPHEAPGAMTAPLMALAVGAMIAGFIGIPQALGGNNALEQFLAPSFSVEAGPAPGAAGTGGAADRAGLQSRTETAGLHLAPGLQLALMIFSVLVAGAGLFTAWHFYITRPEVPRALAAKWPGLHALLVHKYYVDELYQSTLVSGTLASARGLWSVDRRIVDGAVNGAAALTQIASWVSHMLDKHVVDGAVNLGAWSATRGSFAVRRVQTGLVQNYALLMVAGMFVFLTVYLLAR
jgi:NADH-quinone oxidoreductase subunit L